LKIKFFIQCKLLHYGLKKAISEQKDAICLDMSVYCMPTSYKVDYIHYSESSVYYTTAHARFSLFKNPNNTQDVYKQKRCQKH